MREGRRIIGISDPFWIYWSVESPILLYSAIKDAESPAPYHMSLVSDLIPQQKFDSI